jgi:putative ABC transport system ATP-binding protein
MLEVRGATKTFNPGTSNATRALRGVDLTLAPGSFAILVGTNGSGKSTLLNAVAGGFMLDAGTIRINGQDVTRWPEHRRAACIGRVFQNPFSGTAPRMTIEENLVLASRRGLSRGLGPASRRREVEALKDRVRTLGMGLENRFDAEIGTLSGGQRQALTLLMASLRTPQLLLLDEHTAALDPKSADQVIHLTRDIVQRASLTTLMVTHSMWQAIHLGDRVVMFHKGRIVRDYAGAEKARLRPDDLLAQFDDVRRMDQLDPSAAEMLRAGYV